MGQWGNGAMGQWGTDTVVDHDSRVQLCLELGLVPEALYLLKEQFSILRINQGFRSAELYRVINLRIETTNLAPPYKTKDKDLEDLIDLQLYSAKQIFTDSTFEHLSEKAKASLVAINFYVSKSITAGDRRTEFSWLGKAYMVSQAMVADYLDLIDVSKWSSSIANGYWYDQFLNQTLYDAYQVNLSKENLSSRQSLQKATKSYSDVSDLPALLYEKPASYFLGESNMAQQALDWYLDMHSEQALAWIHPVVAGI